MSREEAKRDIIVYHAIWDERIGPVITDSVNEDNGIDLEDVTLQIFQSFQLVFGNAADVKFEKTSFFLPLKSIHKIAKIFLDNVENEEVRGGLQPYSIVILLPEEFPSEKLTIFDTILNNMSVYFMNENRIDLVNYIEDITEIYLGQLFEEDLSIELEDSYTFTAAVNDFKNGLELFKKQNYTSAYRLIKKASIRFNSDNQANLIAESTYLLSTILVQRSRYASALEYYKKLIKTSEDIQKEKYIEQGIFMAGFCYFKLKIYGESLNYLKKLDVGSLVYVKPVKYLLILARVYQNLKMHVKAADVYQQCLEYLPDMTGNEAIVKQKAQIYYSLGIENFRIGMASLKTLGMEHSDAMNEHLNRSIEYLQQSSTILKTVGDQASLISTYKLIAQIFGFRKKKEKQVEHLYLARTAAEESNDIQNQIKIIDMIVQLHNSLNQYDEIIDLINMVFDKISTSAFIDMFSVAKFHQYKGEAFLNLGLEKEALDEFLITLSTYKKIDSPLIKQRQILIDILEIYKQREEQDRIDYYSKLLQKIDDQIDKQPITVEGTNRPFGPVKELWIMSEIGPELYNYAPDTEVDTDLLGGFMTAMQAFSMELKQEKLNSLVIGRDRYDIVKEEGMKFFLLGRSSVKIPENVTHRILIKVSQLFYKEFKENIDDFNGDVTPYRNFTDIVKKTDFTYV